MPETSPLFRRLLAALKEPLPGESAHREVWPPHLPRRDSGDPESYRMAAVLLALLPAGDGVKIPLIRRHADLPAHPGQIALPGGERNPGEDPETCALREAAEEVGLPPARVAVMGRLTPVPIAVSTFLVDPVVGWVAGPEPEWVLASTEVEAILFADPDRLAREGATAFVERSRGGLSWRAPAYLVEGERVWGATALILAEFLAVWRRLT